MKSRPSLIKSSSLPPLAVYPECCSLSTQQLHCHKLITNNVALGLDFKKLNGEDLAPHIFTSGQRKRCGRPVGGHAGATVEQVLNQEPAKSVGGAARADLSRACALGGGGSPVEAGAPGVQELLPTLY